MAQVAMSRSLVDEGGRQDSSVVSDSLFLDFEQELEDLLGRREGYGKHDLDRINFYLRIFPLGFVGPLP